VRLAISYIAADSRILFKRHSSASLCSVVDGIEANCRNDSDDRRLATSSIIHSLSRVSVDRHSILANTPPGSCTHTHIENCPFV
jgi:hypothetical protein